MAGEIWVAADGGYVVKDKDGVATAAFTKDGQKASVTVTSKGQISDVKIEVTKEQ